MRSVFVSRVLIVAGLALIAWPVYVSTDSAIAQWSGRRQLARAVQAERALKSQAPVRDAQDETIVVRKPGTAPEPTVARGTVLGQFDVPRLGIKDLYSMQWLVRGVVGSVSHVPPPG